MHGLMPMMLMMLVVGAWGKPSVVCSFRRDAFLPSPPYYENLPPPVHGGRVMAVISGMDETQVGGMVSVNGISMRNLTVSDPDMEYADWSRVLEGDGFVVVMFHTRNTVWIPDAESQNMSKRGADVGADAGADVGFGGNAPRPPPLMWKGDGWVGECLPEVQPVVLSYATPMAVDPVSLNASSEWVLHFDANHLALGESCSVDEIEVGGKVVGGGGFAMGQGEHRVVVVERGEDAPVLRRGGVWSVAIKTTCSSGWSGWSGWGGRVPGAGVPIAMRAVISCPFPVYGNTTWWSELEAGGVNGMFFQNNRWDICPNPPNDSTADALSVPAYADLDIILEPMYLPGMVANKAESRVWAVIAGGETDVLDHYKVTPSLRRVGFATEAYAETAPNVLSLAGAGTNRQVGLLAGMADVQAVDAYIGGCAPTMVNVPDGTVLQPQYALAYAWNAHANQAPLQSLMWSQLVFYKWPYNARGPTIAIQIASTFAGGSRGSMLFALDKSNFDALGSGWDTYVAPLLRSFVAVSDIIALGSIGGLEVTTSDDTGHPLWEQDSYVALVRSPSHMLMIVINFAGTGYNATGCNQGQGKYWDWSPHVIDWISLSLSSDVGGVDLGGVTEVVDGVRVGVEGGVEFVEFGGAVFVRGVELDADVPVRLFEIPYELHERPCERPSR